MNTSDTKIWIKVPSLDANTTTNLYFYYGNSSASNTESATNVFEFWEGFDTGLGAFSHSGNCSDGYSVVDGVLTVQKSSFSTSTATSFNMNNGYYLESKLIYLDASSGNTYSGVLEANSHEFGGCSSNNCEHAVVLYMRENNNSTNIHNWIGDGSTDSYNVQISNVTTSTDNTWYILGEKLMSDSVEMFKDYQSEQPQVLLLGLKI